MKGALYAESSAIVRMFVEGDALLRARLVKAPRVVTSSLMETEVRRALLRAGHEHRFHPRDVREAEARFHSFLRDCDVVGVTDEILARAAQEFPIEPVRTLDAVHLASALYWHDLIGSLTMVSCDDRVRQNAKALGWKVLPA